MSVEPSKDQPPQGAVCIECGYEYQDAEALGSHHPQERQPCPRCGTKGIAFRVHLTDKIVTREMLGLKSKHEGGRKPFVEAKIGDSLHRDSGRWMKLERRIDRDNNQYHEKVTDAETSEVIHACDEPLSQHMGHGSAKAKDA